MTATVYRFHTARSALFLFAAMLLLSALTGCDAMDPNAAEDAPQADASFSASKSEGALPFVDSPHVAPDIVPLWFDLLGTWAFVQDVTSTKQTLTFKDNQTVKVQIGCLRYKGTFSSESYGHLDIHDFMPTPKSCASVREPALITALKAATGYKVAERQLYISGTAYDEADQTLRFVAVAASPVEDHYVGPPDTGEPAAYSDLAGNEPDLTEEK